MTVSQHISISFVTKRQDKSPTEENILNRLSRFLHFMCPYFKQWLAVIIIRPQPNKKKFEGNDERNNENKILAGLLVFQHVALA
ncbi:hypothetical protein SAMN05660206_104142 [Sphingobacterium wenxiniae]|uniref:Uncharacterized protein n=1 Tax=Sphingobacterium wenxiniae TaxID=683125 RepID=A0A1I6S767_9SPHI|nr:hypothetical protein SAMN05660206_104142 [Sphingobacterium wenxiniae]